MGNIIRLSSEKQLDELKKEIETKGEYIGFGSEGSCYKYNNEAYKILENNFHDINKIITTNDVNLDSFAFPDKTFVIDDQMVIYTSKLIKNNIFTQENLYNDKFIELLDYKKLKLAYVKMQKDVIELTKNGILIDDLPFNLTFDKEKLVAIDTCFYRHESIGSELLLQNLKSLYVALQSVFQFNIPDEIKHEYGLNKEKNPGQYIKRLDMVKKDLF